MARVRWRGRVGRDPWQGAFMAIAGLLLIVIFGGVAGMTLNENVMQVTEQTLRFDVALENLGDDLRVAVLDVRHFHRNIAFGGTSPGAIADFERAYAILLDRVVALEQLGLRDPRVPAPSTMRAMVEAYYADFRPALNLYDTDRVAFTRASENGLSRLTALNGVAEAIDRLGEQRAEEALLQIERAARTARLIHLAEFAGFGLIGLVLAYVAVQILRELRDLHTRAQVASEALAQVSQAKSDFMAEFIADVSYELRTPLTVLRGNAEVGLQIDSSCDHAATLQEIVRESASMARIVDDLLLVARAEGTPPPLELGVFEVEPVLAELAERAEVLARERGSPLQVELAVDGRVQLDRSRIEQAVLTLVDNAARNAPTGVPLMLAASTDARELHLEVSDGRPGVDLARDVGRRMSGEAGPEQQSHAIGLGMSIARVIVEAHGGRLELASRDGNRTHLVIHLPRFPASAPGAGEPGRTTVESERGEQRG